MNSSRRSSLSNVVLLTVVALLSVGLLAGSSIVLASHAMTRTVDKQVQTTAAVSSVVIGLHTTDLVALEQSYATRPSLIAELAAGKSGDAGVESTLASLAHAIPGISATFVASVGGTSLATYPLEPSVIGSNFAYRDWYKGLTASGHPYVSNAIVTKETSHGLAVVVTDYIRGDGGRPIGILGVNYSLASVQSFSANVGRAQGISLTVTDRLGTSLTSEGAHGLVSLATDPRVHAAQSGRSGLMEYAPRLPDGHRGPIELSAFTGVPGTGWTVTASIPKSVAFAALARLRDAVLLIAMLLALILLVGIRLLARSTRHRHESELQVQSRDRELLQVLESADEGFVSINAAGAITAWNGRAERLYGWSAPDVLGRGWVDTTIPAAYRDQFKEDLAGIRAGSDSVLVGKRVELTALHRDGHEIPVEVGVWAHEDGGGFSAFVHDITDRAATQAELESARDQAMQASRLKSEFLANMSHEIRTPMNGVIGISGLLLITDLDVEQREYAETICYSAEALLTVIDDILDFSKIEAGKLDVESVPFDLRSVIEEAAALVAARAHHDGLELTCRIDPALPASLQGDSGRLRQVLLNLLGNAVKFTSSGEVNVTALVAGDVAAGCLSVELSVRDTGIGMSEPTLGLLFDSFTQADSSTSRRYGGTGLGLAISRQLVELMGGTLTATSEAGTGSNFSAVIPFRLGATMATPADPVPLIGVRVLIVDDNATNKRVLQDMVTGWGGISASADGADDALARLSEMFDDALPFDVIVLDANMPGIDGYRLARMVQAEPRFADTPMIMLTSSAEPSGGESRHQAGIVAHIAKPVRAAQLRSAFQAALAIPTLSGLDAEDPDIGPRVLAGGAGPSPGPVRAPADGDVVLLVEDNVVNQKVFTAMLARLGYRVDVAANGFDGLAAMDRSHYLAVFMDCQMPIMDGYQTTQKLRQREGADRDTKVIAVTASAMADDRDRCLEAGMDDYLSKPLRFQELSDMLDRWAARGYDDVSGREPGRDRSGERGAVLGG